MKLGPVKIDVDVRVRDDRDRDLLEQIREIVMATQEQVDAIVARIDASTTAIRQDIADIKAAHPEIDLGPLEASVAGLESLDAENPTAPEEPTDPVTR
jgi:hypothetical protein